MSRTHTARPRSVDPVRDAAVGILLRVERDRAYADILLDRATDGMNARDAAFCTALTLGVLRRRAQLDWLLNRLLRKPLGEAAPAVRQILRAGAFQILHMDVRKAAAVDESVKLAKAHASPNAAKLVNAVLRRLDAADAFGRLHALDVRKVRSWSLLTGVPDWYARGVHDVWPGEFGAYVCAAAVSQPPLTVRVNTARTTVGDLQDKLRAAGIGAFPHAIAPDVLTVYCPAPVLVGSAPFRAGLCHVQDGSSVLAALALDAQPGERVADLCSAPGGKTAVLAAAVGDAGRVVAVESHSRRAALVRELIEREGFLHVEVVEADATGAVEQLPAGGFDRVLVDAPCSALGVARHRPDVLWGDAPDLERDVLPTQRALLRAGARLLRPGGVLVYSVCTFTPEETAGVVDACLTAESQLAPDALPPLFERWTQGPGRATIAPGADALDGFFIQRLCRRT